MKRECLVGHAYGVVAASSFFAALKALCRMLVEKLLRKSKLLLLEPACKVSCSSGP
jgi:hypothetical protein